VVADSWWEHEKWPSDLVPYAILIRAFLEERLTSREFRALFFALFKSDEKSRPQAIFDILDGLFADIDSYVYDHDLRRRIGGLNEQQLRERVREAENRLAAISKGHSA
jgi:Bacterial self-protective colicin-like immunity